MTFLRVMTMKMNQTQKLTMGRIARASCKKMKDIGAEGAYIRYITPLGSATPLQNKYHGLDDTRRRLLLLQEFLYQGREGSLDPSSFRRNIGFRRPFSSVVASDDADDGSSTFMESEETKKPPPYVKFTNARLAYPVTVQASSSSLGFQTAPINLDIFPSNLNPNSNKSRSKTNNNHESGPQRQGGYALLGPNGSGKSLLGQALKATASMAASQRSGNDDNNTNRVENPFLFNSHTNDGDGVAGRIETLAKRQWHSLAVAQVSFDSHQELLHLRDPKHPDEPLTAFKAIAMAGGAPGKLNKAAQFLVVRFGLYPLLHRTVDTLSTGEIRKVLLIRALSQRPKLVVLDNAFDGLDVPSRDILKDIVSRTLRGFTQDILVQGVSSRAANEAQTQIVLSTHRHEELVDEIDTILSFHTEKDGNNQDGPRLKVFKRNNIAQGGQRAEQDTLFDMMPAQEVLHRAMGLVEITHTDNGSLDWNDPTLPSLQQVKSWWEYEKDLSDDSNTNNKNNNSDILVHANDLSIHRGGVTLLHNLTWTVKQGERWIIGGGNGAGKSTLSRLLANSEYLQEQQDKEFAQTHLRVVPECVGWVSTESHLKQHFEKQRQHLFTTKELLEKQTNGASWDNVILPILHWLAISEETNVMADRPFYQLSQGQQKLVLIAAAIAMRPPLLVLDEPCQGLDLISRQRMLKVLERLCASTDISLIYITHHLDEELIPSATHALHLQDRRAVYEGSIKEYHPADFYNSKSSDAASQ